MEGGPQEALERSETMSRREDLLNTLKSIIPHDDDILKKYDEYEAEITAIVNDLAANKLGVQEAAEELNKIRHDLLILQNNDQAIARKYESVDARIAVLEMALAKNEEREALLTKTISMLRTKVDDLERKQEEQADRTRLLLQSTAKIEQNQELIIKQRKQNLLMLAVLQLAVLAVVAVCIIILGVI